MSRGSLVSDPVRNKHQVLDFATLQIFFKTAIYPLNVVTKYASITATAYFHIHIRIRVFNFSFGKRDDLQVKDCIQISTKRRCCTGIGNVGLITAAEYGILSKEHCRVAPHAIIITKSRDL